MLILTAANGDVLRATHENGASDASGLPTITFADDFHVVAEGTGRFEEASGGGRETGTVEATTSTFTVRMEGSITYRAANRSDG